jgi:hypothetical protein
VFIRANYGERCSESTAARDRGRYSGDCISASRTPSTVIATSAPTKQSGPCTAGQIAASISLLAVTSEDDGWRQRRGYCFYTVMLCSAAIVAVFSPDMPLPDA